MRLYYKHVKKSYQAQMNLEFIWEKLKLTSRPWFVMESYTYVLKTAESENKIQL